LSCLTLVPFLPDLVEEIGAGLSAPEFFQQRYAFFSQELVNRSLPSLFF